MRIGGGASGSVPLVRGLAYTHVTYARIAALANYS